MTKPFSPREVIARMKAILRRTEARQIDDELVTREMQKEATDIELEELSQQGDNDENFYQTRIQFRNLEVHVQGM